MPDYDIVDPDPAALIESLRAFGYTTATAIADLIDNSITALAKNIWVTFHWDGPSSWIRIDDDGLGMSEDTLKNAMRPGSQSPRLDRDPKDLGRFGLGLKSASFSQCRLLTVRSRRQGKEFAVRAWDLDLVERRREWRLQRIALETSEQVLAKAGVAVNTSVVWERMDRVVDRSPVSDRRAHELFLALQADVEAHLAMTFHRFMQAKPRPLKLWMNDRRVEAWDPFLLDEEATETLEQDVIRHLGERIVVQPYVLPHHSKLSRDAHKRASGPRGWNAHQGFYVYRSQRLLLPGDWLGLPMRKEEHYKLARIQVDIPNSMDDAWHIDVKKAVARPPGALKPDLVRIANYTRQRAAGVYRFRGKQRARAAAGPYALVWSQKVTREKVHYSINRAHPLIADLRSEAGGLKTTVDAVLRLIEETVPTALITMELNDDETRQSEAFETAPGDLVSVLHAVYLSLTKSGLTPAEAIGRLAVMEPFARYPEAVETLAESGETGT